MKLIAIVIFLVNVSIVNAMPEIHFHAKDGRVEEVKKLLDNDPNLINSTTKSGDTPLHWAIRTGRETVVNILLEYRANITAVNDYGNTCLHVAAESNRSELAKLMLRKGADIHAKNMHGETPLHEAARTHSNKTIRTLLKAGADIKAKNNYGHTPMDKAMRSRRLYEKLLNQDNTRDDLKEGILLYNNTINILSHAEETNSIPPPSCFAQLPLKLSARETGGLEQRVGDPIRIKAKRSFIIQTGSSHKSENNIVAIYIGLPTPDPAHDNVVIEEIHSEKANPENMIFSPKQDSLLVEYFNVHPGFKDEITMTFSLDLYRRKADLSFSKEQPYDKQSPEYIKYIKPPDTEPDPKLQKHLKLIGVDPKRSAIINARKIYHYLGKQLRYGHYTPDKPIPDDLLNGGKAHCGVYSTFFARMCCEAGIPARRCAGFLLGTDPADAEKTTVSAHNWAEFYVEGIGWIPVDPTMGDKKDLRKKYYFGSIDNAHLCISKGGLHDQLPIWYKKNASSELIFTNNADDFRPGSHPDTIQGAHRFQFRWDRPIQISVLNSYGAENMQVLSRQGTIQMPKIR